MIKKEDIIKIVKDPKIITPAIISIGLIISIIALFISIKSSHSHSNKGGIVHKQQRESLGVNPKTIDFRRGVGTDDPNSPTPNPNPVPPIIIKPVCGSCECNGGYNSESSGGEDPEDIPFSIRYPDYGWNNTNDPEV